MKKCILIIFCFWLIPSVELKAESFSSHVFEQANRLYEGGEYQSALEAYQRLEKTGFHWKLFYNMGNCHYKLNQFLQAKIYYLRAQRLQPVEPSVTQNITIVDQHFNNQIPEVRGDFISRLVSHLEAFVTLNWVSIVVIILVFLINILIYLLISRGRGPKKIIIYSLAFAILLLTSVGAYHIYRVKKINTRRIAVVIQADSQLHSGPGSDNTVLFKVYPGLTLRIIDRSRDWAQVSASTEIAGWIKLSHLEVI